VLSAPDPGDQPAEAVGVIDARTARLNLIALTAASFIGFTGFTLVMPFLPLYIAQLGVRDVATVALWTGLCLGVTPAVTALLAPAWGRIADRYGRKLLVVRSLISFILLMSAMAFVRHPWHVLALRAIQGVFAGYGALCLAMAADSARPGRIAQSIGLVQTAQRLGPALGPVLGGAIAAVVGIRTTFFVTASFYLIALVQMLVLYREPPPQHADAASGGRVTIRRVLSFENLLLLIVVIFGFQLVDRSLGPILPLFVAALGVRPGDVTFVAGIAFSVLACGAAAGHHLTASLLARSSGRHAIAGAAIVAALAAGAVQFVHDWRVLVACTAVFGLGVGVATTAAYTAAATAIPSASRGAGFGVLTSASLAAMALSPILSGFVAATSIRAVFVLDAVVLCVLALIVRQLMVEEQSAPASPPTEDA